MEWKSPLIPCSFHRLFILLRKHYSLKTIKIMNMTGNVRPADMERITTPALAQVYIEEQIK